MAHTYLLICCWRGGVDENNLQGRCSVSVLNVETFLCDNIQFDQSFNSAGHSVCKLSNDCLMICGGMHLQYFVYTSKPMVPSPCDFGNGCKIIESSEMSPISWIQCEGLCKRWLHQFSVGVLDTDMSGRIFFVQLVQSLLGVRRENSLFKIDDISIYIFKHLST